MGATHSKPSPTIVAVTAGAAILTAASCYVSTTASFAGYFVISIAAHREYANFQGRPEFYQMRVRRWNGHAGFVVRGTPKMTPLMIHLQIKHGQWLVSVNQTRWDPPTDKVFWCESEWV